MSVVYRAIWRSDLRDDADIAVARFRAVVSCWAAKREDATPLPDGTAELPGRTLTLTPRRDDLPGLDTECVDAPNQYGAVWTTVARTAVQDGGVHVLVENRVESDDISRPFSVGRPRLVGDLLAEAGTARVNGGIVLSAEEPVSAVQVTALVEHLQSKDRSLPCIVFSEPPAALSYNWRRLAELTAARAAGVANVFTLDHAAVTVFRRQLADLAVWGGGVRTYVPVPVDPATAYQHRYIRGFYIERAGSTRIVDRLVFAVAQLSSRRRVPELFPDSLGTTEAADAAEDAKTQRSLIEHLQFELELERAEHEETERELARSRGHLYRLEDVFKRENRLETYYGTMNPPAENDLPDEVEAVSEAVLAAQLYLSDELSVPDNACANVAPLDAADNAVAWGNTTWRGLRALAAYVRDRREGFDGDFWTWCAAGRPEGWPASPKKLTMRESDSVRQNPKFWDKRRLPVDPSLNITGWKHMEAHLKIAEGGGNLAPRVYFFDDTTGGTGKVHVGLVGPHYLVPNTKT